MSAPGDPLVFFTDRDLGTRFGEILTEAGLTVNQHRSHFPADFPDEVWLGEVGEEGWIAVTHDTRIRYKPNELAAVIHHDVRLLVVIGKAPFPELAGNFIATFPKIRQFVETYASPWIAKVYRPSPAELARSPTAPGTVSLWYPSTKKP